ncbi:MAG: T9SS type A sorting domain-containing protein [Candidatus Cloacimonetes bacterium]|jgi:predicted outer membrane repeat protein|nr:T9SS type A sorting domain-containing protein [Candidatus Cloacimonadota bacterium]
MFNCKKIFFLIFILILLSSALYSTILNVPGTYGTIQDAIYYSLDADTVLVQPGLYYENINYNGKNITIGSLFLTTQNPDYIVSTIIDGSSNGSVVTFENGEDDATLLCGFTITNGEDGQGGGIYCYNSNPTFENLIVIGNSSISQGGGIYCSMSDSVFENLTISGNISNHSGGGIYSGESNLTLKNLMVTNNTDTAGGIYGKGGGIRFWHSNSILENVVITGNSANEGGGIDCFRSNPILENITISGNSANVGGGMNCFDSTPILANCILWDDSPEEIFFTGFEDPDSIIVAYSDIDGGYNGIVINGEGTIIWPTGNININPLFVNPSIEDYHLQSLSPCIDAGDPDPQYDDPDGTRADMGGLYFNQAPVADFTADTTVGIPPLTVNFTDLSTEGIGVIDEWYWDFGDGNTSTEQDPSNEYQDFGEYTVSLTVTNIYDFTDTITKEEYIVVNATGYNGPVWHISTTGSDEYGNGSEELPFATIQHGIDVSANSDTVLVESGTYVENVLFDEKLVTVGSHFLTTGNEDYISSTIIDGNNNPGVVSFTNVNSSNVLSGFTITNSAGGNYGGGVNCYLADPTLRNLIITGNSAIYQGGGIKLEDSNPILVDVTISNNSSESGAGIFCIASDPILRNVTITGNTATNYGGGIFCYDGSEPSLVNSIIWNNDLEEIFFHDDSAPNSITVSYSDIEDGEAGIVTNGNGTVDWLDGNINLDPMFVDAESGDYHLQFGSPCIDAGDPTLAYDPDGSISDMGAWFYDHGNAINENEIQPIEFSLSNYPNPFNPLTTIKFDINEQEVGKLSIYNIKGQLIESQQFNLGEHSYQWDASNQASGVYLYKLETENTTVNRKMLLLK